MRKIQVKRPDGWKWLFCRKMPEKTVMTCADKHKALPSDAFHAEEDLAWANHTWPDEEFRLAETLEQP